MIETCPTDVIAAPAERIWRLLTVPEKLAAWTGERLLQAPARPVQTGDRLVFAVGPMGAMRLTIDVREMDAPRELRLFIQLPLGIANDELVRVTPVGDGRCRVSFL
jgi:uncharacterized protein YndB with AHSA1/START domain